MTEEEAPVGSLSAGAEWDPTLLEDPGEPPPAGVFCDTERVPAGTRLGQRGSDAMPDTSDHDADAIRYAVLRKLASGMRHTLMGELQALQFSAELAARLLDGSADAAKVAEHVRQLPAQSRAALASCRSMVEWLRPDDRATATLEDAVLECLRVAGDDWKLRGIEASTDLRGGDTLVSKPALREVLTTSLLALTDTHRGPADVAIHAGPDGHGVTVTVRVTPAERRSPLPPLAVYRALDMGDVMTLARDRGIACSCADRMVTLRLDIVPKTG